MTAYQLFRDIFRHLRSLGMRASDIATVADRSEQTVRRYMCEPGTKSALLPPVKVIDRLVRCIDTFQGGNVTPETDDARLRKEWRDVFDGCRVPRAILADIAGLDIATVACVGRENPTFAIQPTDDMVRKAMATEALMQRRGVAA
ncbi:hypothetical protein [Rhizobium sp. Kim5]|uniref:hypothetical protein n=1 Tax=Rhizobium sp. Kim5 TaxID=2020311 RepID=UPI0001904D90|nr:hypothetical protein [Rhizobium sp. Kim5]